MERIGTPEFRALMRIEEPYEYRTRLTLPKLILNAAGDQFFLPDSSRFYFDDLPGEKHLRYIPNTDHSLDKSDVMAGAMAASIFGSLLLASLVGARIPFAMSRDGVFVGALAHLSPRTRVPVRALVAQAIWAGVLVLSGSYDTITDYAIFAVLIFVALSTASVFVFRRRLPDLPRAYRTWGYPVVPVLFLLVAIWILINTLITTPGRAVAGLGLMAAGLPFYWYWTRAAGRGRAL